MSEYLSRLATRARAGNETQLLRPFVRSLSPIADHDQRIGTGDREGFELVGAPPGPTGFESTAGSPGEFETGTPPDSEPRSEMGGPTVRSKLAAPDQTRLASMASSLGDFESRSWPVMTPEKGLGEATVQRKMAASAADKAGPSSYLAPTGPGGANKARPSPEATEVSSGLAELAAGGGGGVRAAVNQSEFKDRLAPPETSRIEPNLSLPKTSDGEGEPFISFTRSARPDTQNSEGSGMPAATHRVGQVGVHTRSVRQQSEIDSPRLQPKAHVFADHFEPSPGDSAASSAAAAESPRIVIGRINVEVVPPPAQRIAPAPRPRPLTAASVSVIGPLGGVRPNTRFSLRYR